jgi:hypothetical protein
MQLRWPCYAAVLPTAFHGTIYSNENPITYLSYNCLYSWPFKKFCVSSSPNLLRPSTYHLNNPDEVWRSSFHSPHPFLHPLASIIVFWGSIYPRIQGPTLPPCRKKERRLQRYPKIPNGKYAPLFGSFLFVDLLCSYLFHHLFGHACLVSSYNMHRFVRS